MTVPDLVRVVVRLARVARRRRVRERGRKVENAVAGRLIDPGRRDVARRPAQDLRNLACVEIGARRPQPRGRTGHDRRREARARRGGVPTVECRGDGDVDAGGGEVDVRRLAREERDLAGRVGGGDGEHVRKDSGVAEWVAEVARVPGRRHDEGPEADGLTHRGLDRRVLRLRAEAQVDHGSPGPGSGEDALHDLARLEPHSVPDRRVVRADHSLRDRRRRYRRRSPARPPRKRRRFRGRRRRAPAPGRSAPRGWGARRTPDARRTPQSRRARPAPRGQAASARRRRRRHATTAPVRADRRSPQQRRTPRTLAPPGRNRVRGAHEALRRFLRHGRPAGARCAAPRPRPAPAPARSFRSTRSGWRFNWTSVAGAEAAPAPPTSGARATSAAMPASDNAAARRRPGVLRVRCTHAVNRQRLREA